MKKIKTKFMTCADCGIKFETAWSDEEADKEAKELWGIDNASKQPSTDVVVICDPCYQANFERFEKAN